MEVMLTGSTSTGDIDKEDPTIICGKSEIKKKQFSRAPRVGIRDCFRSFGCLVNWY